VQRRAFNRDGELIYAPADRGLDYFATQPGVEGVIVDTANCIAVTTTSRFRLTRRVGDGDRVGSHAAVERLTVDACTPTPTYEGTPPPRTCDRVSPNAE
jgi:hypothetical protein